MPPEKYNHAIWSALYMADFIADYNFPEQMNRLLIVAIFLHEFMDLQTVLAGGDLKILLEDFGLDYECRFMMLMFIQSANFIAESTFKHDFFIKTRKLFESYSLSFKKSEAPQRAILLKAIVLFNKAHLLGVEVYKSKDYAQRRLRAIDFDIPNTDINSRLSYYTYLSNQASTKAPKVVNASNALINIILKEIDLL